MGIETVFKALIAYSQLIAYPQLTARSQVIRNRIKNVIITLPTVLTVLMVSAASSMAENSVVVSSSSLSSSSLSSSSLSSSSLSSSSSGKDHGEIAPEHEQSTYKFITKYLKNDRKEYDAKKIAAFIERLQEEKKSLKEDLYQTKLLEKIEVEVVRYRKAVKSAEKRGSEDSRPMIGYNEYLIPKMQQLYKLVSTNREPDKWDGLVDDFIRGYATYYVPNQQKTFFSENNNPTQLIKKIFTSYEFKENDPRKIEAFNLRVGDNNQAEISNCLGTKVTAGTYLNQTQINKLKNNCKYDISKIDPGVSAFWQELSINDRKNIFTQYDSEFPTENEKLTYVRTRYKGFGSPKMTVSFVRSGREYRIKLKTGREVNTDAAGTFVGRLLGFNMDHSKYRKKVRVYLGNLSYRDFVAEFASKWKNSAVENYVTAHGIDSTSREEWIELLEGLFESRWESQIRISGLDLNSWDFTNRREYRAFLLWLAWTSTLDFKIENCKLLFERTKDGLVPLHRMSDVGYSFGVSNKFHTPIEYWRRNINYIPNSFREHVVYYPRKGEVKIDWNDFLNRSRNFGTTTWNDLKWLTRKIARLSKEEIKKCFLEAGMPEEAAALYQRKMIIRRNDMVSAFDLKDEFPLIPVPEVPDSEFIKNNQLVLNKIHEGVVNTPTEPINWITIIDHFVRGATTLYDYDNIQQMLNNKYNAAFSGHPVNANYGIGLDRKMNNTQESPENLNKGSSSLAPAQIIGPFTLGAGISFTINRYVETNGSHGQPSEGRARLYMISDTLSFSIGGSSSILNSLCSLLPASIGGHIKFLNKGITFIHFAGNLKHAYFAPLKIFKFVFNSSKYGLKDLLPGELIRFDTSYGLDVAVAASLSLPLLYADTVVKNGVAMNLQWFKEKPIYYMRDMYGAFHVYNQESLVKSAGAGITVGSLGMVGFSDSFFNLTGGVSSFNYHGKDFMIEPLEYVRENASKNIKNSDHVQEQNLLKQINNNQQNKGLSTGLVSDQGVLQTPGVVQTFDIKSKGKIKSSDKSFFYIYGKHKESSDVSSQVTLQDGDKFNFLRLQSINEQHYGQTDTPVSLLSSGPVALKSLQGKEFALEMDEENPKNFVMIIRAVDYLRGTDRQGITEFVNSINHRFSEKKLTLDSDNASFKEKEYAFFRNYILPPKEDLDRYIKVSASIRVYLNGNKIVRKIDDMSLEELYAFVDREYDALNLKKYTYKSGFSISRSKMGLYFKKRKIKSLIKELKVVLDKDHQNYHQIAKGVFKLVKELYSNQHGINVIRELWGTESMFVFGEISGILNSFSNLPQDGQSFAIRRFAGKSWGHLDYYPPIQHYLRHKAIQQPLENAAALISQSEMFGPIIDAIPMH